MIAYLGGRRLSVGHTNITEYLMSISKMEYTEHLKEACEQSSEECMGSSGKEINTA